MYFLTRDYFIFYSLFNCFDYVYVQFTWQTSFIIISIEDYSPSIAIFVFLVLYFTNIAADVRTG